MSTRSGSLHSKFDGKPKYMEQVGLFLKSQVLKDFVPKFVVSRRLSHADAQSYDFTQRYEVRNRQIHNRGAMLTLSRRSLTWNSLTT